MFDAFIQGLLVVLQWQTFLVMLLGIVLGFWVGLLPGLGGSTTLALMLPFIYKMTPVEAFAFLLGSLRRARRRHHSRHHPRRPCDGEKGRGRPCPGRSADELACGRVGGCLRSGPGHSCGASSGSHLW